MESKKYYIIYETVNLINGKNYIGQHVTTNLNDGYMGSGTILKRAINKYGKKNFRTEILFYAVNQDSLNFLEKCLVTPEFIEQNDNYNLREGGDVGTHSVETRRKMSEAKMGKKGNPHTPETKALLSKYRKGVAGTPCTEENRIRGRERAIKLNLRPPSPKGRKLSKEIKNRIAQTLKGVKHTEERVANITKAQRMRRILDTFYCA